jgi:hypothetical protein
LRSYGNSNGIRIFTQDATDLTLGTNDTPRMTISSTGVVNIANLTASKMVTTDANQNLATTYDVNQSLATTSNVQFGGLGVGVAPTTEIIGNFQKNQDTYTIMQLVNTNSGIVTATGFAVYTDSDQHGALVSYSTLFSTDGLKAAGSSVLYSDSNTNGLRVFTVNATDLTLGTNNTARMTINSSGNLGFETTDIETWNTSYRAIESVSSSIMFQTSGTTDMIALLSNVYLDTGGSDKYKTTNEVAGVYLYDGSIELRVASSGTIDNNITWKIPLTIANNGTITATNYFSTTSNNMLVQSIFTVPTDGTAYLAGLYSTTTGSYVAESATNNGEFIGIRSFATINSTNHKGTLKDNFGMYVDTGIYDCGSGGTITNNYGVFSRLYNITGNITNSYMYHGSIVNSSGTITNNWGIHLSGCTKNYLEGSLELDGDFNHDGTNFGVCGTAPQAQQAHIADANGDLSDITSKFNTLLADLEGFGFLASS